MNKKMVFILYDSRSGSTYLAALLNQYKHVSVSLESAFVSRIIEYSGPVKASKLDSIIAYLQDEIQFRELGLNLNELKRSLSELGDKLTKKRLIEAIVSQYFSKRDLEAECIIIKHPPYAYLSTVIDMFSEVQFLQIIRDGRAVFNSKKKTDSLGGDKMATNPLKAAWDWRLKLKKAESHKERTVSIFYEDVVQNQEQTLQYILEKFNILEEGKKITKQQSDYFQSLGEMQKDLHRNVSKSPQVNLVDKWKQELSNSEIKVYNFVNRRYLQKYGYETEQSADASVVFVYGFYLVKFFMEKVKNTILLLRTPSLLRRKFYRNYFMVRDDT